MCKYLPRLREEASKRSLLTNSHSNFQIANSSIRYGIGVTKEVGQDFANMGAKRVCVMTDPFLKNLPAVKTTLDSLTKSGVQFELYDKVRVEPTEKR